MSISKAMAAVEDAKIATLLIIPTLQEGEINCGLIMKEDGTPDYWLIGMNEYADRANHKAQLKWAQSVGGDLPTRQEGRLGAAHGLFKDGWFWLKDQHASHSSCAWCQNSDGHQDDDRMDLKLRARAVRRVPAQLVPVSHSVI